MLLATFSFGANAQTWFESQYKAKNLSKAYKEIDSHFSSDQFSKLFEESNLRCESNLIRKLMPAGPRNVKFALIKAYSLGLVDDVEMDILLDYAKAVGSYDNQAEKFKIQKGSSSLKGHYEKVFKSRGCLEANWLNFSEVVTAQNFNEREDALMALNTHALQAGYINRNEYHLAQMLTKVAGKSSLLVRDYHKKRNRLSEDFEINTSFNIYHDERRTKGSKGLRYSIYANYSPLQIKEMVALLNKLDHRFSQSSSEIIFIDNSGNIDERIGLNHAEQLRLALKLYSREKHELLSKSYFEGVSFSYPTLLAVAFETGQINDKELSVFSKLEKRAKKKNFWQKATSFLTRLDFLASSLGGPIIGIGYSLTVSFVDSLINKKQADPPKYEHDLFYGNCEMAL